MAESMEEVNVGEKKEAGNDTALYYIPCAKFTLIPEVLRDFQRLFESKNSPTIGTLHTVRHVYRSVWPAREAKNLAWCRVRAFCA